VGDDPTGRSRRMMKVSKVAGALVAGLFFSLVVACSGREAPTSQVPVVEGPALIMFYTDN
jgi:hypothetical protein